MNRPPPRPAPNPLETLGNVLTLMEANIALFQPDERQIIQLSRQWHAAKRMPGQDILVRLGGAYQRVKALQEQILQHAEEGMAFIVGTDIEFLQGARAMLDSGRILSIPELQKLQLIQTKTMLPQILETLENQSMLLLDHEYELVRYARAMMDIGGGQVDNATLQKLVNMQNALQIRQYTG